MERFARIVMRKNSVSVEKFFDDFRGQEGAKVMNSLKITSY